MTHSYVRHDSLVCFTRLIRMCDFTNSYVRHHSFLYVCYSFVASSDAFGGSDSYGVRREQAAAKRRPKYTLFAKFFW